MKLAHACITDSLHHMLKDYWYYMTIVFVPHILWNALKIGLLHAPLQFEKSSSFVDCKLTAWLVMSCSVKLTMNDPMNEFKLAFTSDVFRYWSTLPWKPIWRYNSFNSFFASSTLLILSTLSNFCSPVWSTKIWSWDCLFFSNRGVKPTVHDCTYM